MIHHDMREYNVAVGEAARTGRTRMEEIIHRGQANAANVIQNIQNTVIRDRVIWAPAMEFQPWREPEIFNEPGLALEGEVMPSPADPRHRVVLGVEDGQRLELHPHALSQAVEAIGTPHAGRYINLMQSHGETGAVLLSDTLNKLLDRQPTKRYLVRAVDEQARGVLSDKFRRIDAGQMVEAFAETANEVGLMPIDGFALDTKVRIRAILPEVYEPVPNEVMLVGLQWGTSDFGDGGHGVQLFFTRVLCTNTAIGDSVMRQIHVGARLPDNIELSADTIRKDNEANASVLRDVIRGALAPVKVNAMMEDIRMAAEAKLDPDKAMEWLKAKLNREQAIEVANAFNSPDIEMLPAGQTKWRLSNAMSWISQQKPAAVRLEYDRLAGELIPRSQKTEALTV